MDAQISVASARNMPTFRVCMCVCVMFVAALATDDGEALAAQYIVPHVVPVDAATNRKRKPISFKVSRACVGRYFSSAVATQTTCLRLLACLLECISYRVFVGPSFCYCMCTVANASAL